MLAGPEEAVVAGFLVLLGGVAVMVLALIIARGFFHEYL